MWLSGIRLAICSILIGGLVMAVPENGFAAYRRVLVSPVDVKIKLSKEVFNIGEPLEGQVILTNMSPVNIPAIFDIRIFHEDQLVSSLSTRLEGVPQGATKFSFKHFGIPALTKGEDAEGAWRITICQQGRDASDAAEVTIRVVSPDLSRAERK